MKFALILVLAAICFLQDATCYTDYITDARHANYPGKCYAPTSQVAVTRGYEKYVGCKRWTCKNDYTMIKEGCNTVTRKAGCRVVVDSSKKYPGCCARNVC